MPREGRSPLGSQHSTPSPLCSTLTPLLPLHSSSPMWRYQLGPMARSSFPQPPFCPPGEPQYRCPSSRTPGPHCPLRPSLPSSPLPALGGPHYPRSSTHSRGRTHCRLGPGPSPGPPARVVPQGSPCLLQWGGCSQCPLAPQRCPSAPALPPPAARCPLGPWPWAPPHLLPLARLPPTMSPLPPAPASARARVLWWSRAPWSPPQPLPRSQPWPCSPQRWCHRGPHPH